MANSMIKRSARPPELMPSAWPWLAQLYAAAGLDERAQAITTMINKRDGFNTDTTTLAADLGATQITLTYRVINGETPLLDAALELDRAERVAAAAGAVPRLHKLVVAQLAYDLSKSMWQAGDELLREVDQCVQHAAERIVGTAAQLGNITDDASAGRAPALLHETWLRLGNDIETINTCWALAHQLRLNEFVSDVADRHLTVDGDWSWRRPELRVPHVAGTHRVLALARDIDNGAEPGVLCADEVLAVLRGSQQRAG